MKKVWEESMKESWDESLMEPLERPLKKKEKSPKTSLDECREIDVRTSEGILRENLKEIPESILERILE